jgi:hypothetical protein
MKTFPIGARVRVEIKRPRRYAAGAAECLQGMLGTVEQFKPESINGDPAYLVRFDAPARTWWSNQLPSDSFWFPPHELRGVE